MSTFSLRLEKKVAPQREVAAWFLSGQSPEEWLAALSRWSGVQGDLRIYLVPRGGRDPEPEGLLIIPPAGARPPEGWRGHALGAIEQRFFLPVDADLFPPIAPAEVRGLCRAAVTFFHPGVGVVEFGEADVRRVWDFLEPAMRIPADWNSARSEPPLNSTLRGVALEALPGEDEIFGDAAKDIGSSPPTELPSRRQEPSDGPMGKAGRAAAALGAGALAKMMSWFASESPGASSGRQPPSRNWMSGLMDWATAKLTKISQEMEELRHRELHRLMDMLNSDPERGLRHALPLAGDPGRGRATPGARLGERDIRFSLGGSGGRAADPWDIPWELRQKLMARYRELAQQERQLGRFQRAAYIYAQLLGDWTAAVAALKEGGHFAEAAVIFRDRLLQPRAAAECFAAAGLFREAIAIYEKEKMFLELGDLHRKLGNEEAACEAYWRVVEEKTSAGDLLGAAGLLEVQLQLPDNALTMLGKAWPGTPQAARCLTEQFSLLSRLGRHEAARARVVELRDERTPPPKVIGLAEVLAKVCKTYPDRSVGPLAADVARVKIGARLKSGDAAEAKAGTRILSELAPEDRLLARDTSRFLASRLEALARRTAPPPLPPPRKPGSKRVGVPVCKSGFSLLGVKEVLTVTRLGSHFLAAATTKGSKTEIVRGNWGDTGARTQQPAVWTDDQLHLGQIALIHGSHGPVFVLTSPKLLRKEIVLPASDQFLRPLPLSAPHWLPEGFAAMAVNAGHCWILRNANGEWIVDIRSANGYLSGEYSLQSIVDEIPEPVTTVAMLAVRSQVWIALGRYLFQFEQPRRPSRRWTLETPIVGLEPMAPLLAAGVVARCELGAAVFWCDHLNEAEMIATDLAAPFCAPLGNGMIAFLSSIEEPDGFAGRVIDIDRHGEHSKEDFRWNGGAPVGLVAMPQPNGFAVFDQEGKVQTYEVPTVG